MQDNNGMVRADTQISENLYYMDKGMLLFAYRYSWKLGEKSQN